MDEGSTSAARKPKIVKHPLYKKLSNSNILISGMQGLGIEIAKNIVLAGPKSITLHDEHAVAWCDLSSSFTLTEDDVGQNRALASAKELRKLDSSVAICALTNELAKEKLSDFQVVVFTNIDLDKAIEFDAYCHSHKPSIAFIMSDVRGVFGRIFCDFGHSYSHSSVERVSGRRVEKQKVLNFKPLHETIDEPGHILLYDYYKPNLRPRLLHKAFRALDRFRQATGRLPVAGSEEDFQILMQNMTMDGDSEEDDAKCIRVFSFGATAVIIPMATMFGGMVAQEVVKLCSKKFEPIFQYFYFDQFEFDIGTRMEDDPWNLSPMDSRHDAQISVFGSRLQRRIQDAEVFLVGFGALASEILKNLALMGVSCGGKGKINLWDDDEVDRSNITGQFLLKELCTDFARTYPSIRSINSDIKLKRQHGSLGSRCIYGDNFWRGLTVIIDALEDMSWKLYIDERSIKFGKPLLQPEILGRLPHLTQKHDAKKLKAPLCTVQSFPHNIEHCLTWARSEFDILFEKTPEDVNDFLSFPSLYVCRVTGHGESGDAKARDKLGRVLECLNDRCHTFIDCITWARLRFEDYFVNRIRQLTYTFPEGAFWSPPKLFPAPLHFSNEEPSHIDFVLVAAILRAKTFGIQVDVPFWENSSYLYDAIGRVTVPAFILDNAMIVTDERADSLLIARADDKAEIFKLRAELQLCRNNLPRDYKINSVGFEKVGGSDLKYQGGMVCLLATLKARCYGIPMDTDTLRNTYITPIPGLQSSTAVKAGYMCLRLYGLLKSCRYHLYVPSDYSYVRGYGWKYVGEIRSEAGASDHGLRLSRLGQLLTEASPDHDPLPFDPDVPLHPESEEIAGLRAELMSSTQLWIRNGWDMLAVEYIWRKGYYRGVIRVPDKDMERFLSERMRVIRSESATFKYQREPAWSWPYTVGNLDHSDHSDDSDGVGPSYSYSGSSMDEDEDED